MLATTTTVAPMFSWTTREGVVSILRQIVNETRAQGLVADVETVARAAVEAGASSASRAGWGEAGRADVSRRQFLADPRLGSGAGIEVDFHTERQ